MFLYCDKWHVYWDDGVCLVINIEGTDGFSINFSDNVNKCLFIEDFKHMSFLELKSFLEKKWREDKEYFNKYI